MDMSQKILFAFLALDFRRFTVQEALHKRGLPRLQEAFTLGDVYFIC